MLFPQPLQLPLLHLPGNERWLIRSVRRDPTAAAAHCLSGLPVIELRSRDPQAGCHR